MNIPTTKGTGLSIPAKEIAIAAHLFQLLYQQTKVIPRSEKIKTSADVQVK